MPEIRARYGERERVSLVIEGESRTKQSFRDEVNINSVLARYARTGVWASGNNRPPRFEDVSGVGSFHEAIEKARGIRELVADLPPRAQELYTAAPAVFLHAYSEAADRADLEALGLLEPLEAPVEAPVEPAAPAPAQ